MPDLKLISRERHDRLTNDETVTLGRALVGISARSHVSFPNDTDTAVIIIHDFVEELSPATVTKLIGVIGDFDLERIG